VKDCILTEADAISLRYCIECHDPRFWSEAETQFLEFFQNSQVPIVFVLTKFDMVVNQCLVERMRSAGRNVITLDSFETLAMGDAREKIKENICRQLERLVGGGIKAEMISKDGEFYFCPQHMELQSP
jgi:GTP-binding protein EngB required for normal cell division